MPSGDGSRLVHVDANAVIDYIRERTLRDHGMRPTSRRAEALRIHLEQLDNVLVAKTAGMEAKKNLVKDLSQKLKHAESERMKNHALKLLHNYLGTVEAANYLDHVSAVRDMYFAISSDPGSQKFSMWKKKKGMFVADPSLGSDPNDLVILSTAAWYAQNHVVELWTHDMDFTMFVDEIWNTLGVKVVDSHRLGG